MARVLPRVKKSMKELETTPASDDAVSLELGKVLGQSIAFGTIAGRCSAAQAGAIRQARNQKVHERFHLTWNEFCPLHLKISGTQADNLIRLLEEFGPDYFEHTQSVRISADTYRLVAPYIRDKALQFQEETLELNSANVQKVAKTVRDGQRALPAPAVLPILSERLDAIDRQITEVVSALREVSRDAREAEPSPLFRPMFHGILIRIQTEIRRVGLENGIV